MNNSINLFLRCVKAEFYKLKKSNILWLSLLGPLSITALQFARYFYYSNIFIPKPGINAWDPFLAGSWQVISILLLPFYLILISNQVVYIEHKSESWENIFTLPINNKIIFCSKYAVILLLFAVTLIYYSVLQLFSGLTLGYLKKELRLLDYTPEYFQMITLMLKVFFSAIGIISFQFWISLKSKNYIVPLSLGIGGIMFAVLLLNWKHIGLFFFSYPVITIYQNYNVMSFYHLGIYTILTYEIINLLYSVIFLLAGYKAYLKLKSM